jgi:hypothetical protein
MLLSMAFQGPSLNTNFSPGSLKIQAVVDWDTTLALN